EWTTFLKSLSKNLTPEITVLDEKVIAHFKEQQSKELHAKQQRMPSITSLLSTAGEINYRPLSVTRKYTWVPTYKGFLDLFMDRYNKIKSMFSGDPVPLKDAMPGDFCVVMIADVIKSDKRKMLKVMDPSKYQIISIPEGYTNLPYAPGCVIGIKFEEQSQKLKVEEIMLPDVPYPRPISRAPDHAFAVFTSDIHVGSTKFQETQFKRFIKWLSGDCENTRLRNIAKNVRYVFLAGDLVDGVGVYPEQYKEIDIYSYEEQYKYLGELLEEINREDIKIFAIPGDHDIPSLALPQPPIEEIHAKKLYELKVEMLPNPIYMMVHNVLVLLYHGRSLNDVMNTASISIQHPGKAMEVLLKIRHLAPVSENTPIAPLPEDYLTITHIPDIFHAGHIHVNEICGYRGVLIINAGTFQELTLYQKERGIKPTIAQPVLVDLKEFDVNGTNKGISTLDFRF
ncbi:MAG: metallophosphoesterase, partial [Candidatus Korarchaeota archaeon]